MNLRELIARHGADLPLQAFLERCRCQVCGARYPEVGCQAVPEDVPTVASYGMPAP